MQVKRQEISTWDNPEDIMYIDADRESLNQYIKLVLSTYFKLLQIECSAFS